MQKLIEERQKNKQYYTEKLIYVMDFKDIDLMPSDLSLNDFSSWDLAKLSRSFFG